MVPQDSFAKYHPGMSGQETISPALTPGATMTSPNLSSGATSPSMFQPQPIPSTTSSSVFQRMPAGQPF